MTKNKVINSTLLNIDSSYREQYAKNICSSNGKILPQNPLNISYNTITFNYPNHNLSSSDNIVVQNVEGESKTLINSFYLVNNFKYCIIVYNNNNINVNYKDYAEALYINIQIVGSQLSDNIINNVCFNSLYGIKQSLIADDISSSSLNNLQTFATDIFGSYDINILNQNCLFIELPNDYIDNTNNYIQVNQIFKISYLHIGGMNIGYINANYPINNNNYQSSQTITNIIDENTFQIQLKYSSYGSSYQGGGKNIQVMKIINSITGYPNPNYYVINLRKSFSNVTNIQLVSTEFPYIDMVITKNVNDKLYWKNIEDGQNIYNIVIDEGFYSSTTILTKLQTLMNLVPRYNYSNLNQSYNHFDIIIESNIHKITFSPYNLIKLSNSISCRQEVINTSIYYIININSSNSFLQVNDSVTISGSDNITINTTQITTSYSLIDKSYINKTFIIYAINLNNSYDIILGNSDVIKTTSVDYKSNGGPNIQIKYPTKISFLFNYSDTIGNILGFKDVGYPYSIIDYSSSITNQDLYINSNNVDSVGNIVNYSSGFLNFVGTNNYFLMYLNDIDYIQMPNSLNSAFAKILLSENPGNILFNTFVPVPISTYSQYFPISDLSQLIISFSYSDGTNVNFRNINHSFTLQIIQEQYLNDDTQLDSKNVSVLEEFSRANLKD
jgi:hypothetical protein